MRFVVLLFFVLVLGVLSSDLKVTDSVASFLASKHEKVRAADNNFVIYWANELVNGYRHATYDDITTQAFVDEYNSQGIYFNLDSDPVVNNLRCTLAVAEGVLLFPKNDTDKANLMTLYKRDGDFGCELYMTSGQSYFESWPDNFCVSTYNGNEFPSLNVSFMKDNFFTKKEYCATGTTTTNMAVFIRDSITPSPTPSPSFAPTPFPTPTPTPSPTPSSSYVCCGYYDFSEQFETAFCQISGQKCPNSIGSYTGVGNFTVSDCKDCCNKIYTKK